tara:strand:+ start:261 stop:1139 length:879 start_codon:yes stop_codon:yes gene_type:complete
MLLKIIKPKKEESNFDPYDQEITAKTVLKSTRPDILTAINGSPNGGAGCIDRPCLLLRYGGDDLFNRLYTLQEYEICSIMAQLYEALRYMHSRKFVHRDIKLENIVYDANINQSAIIDFGYAKHLMIEKCTEFCGTLTNMYPGILHVRRKTSPLYTTYHGQLADHWSMSIVFFALIFKMYPQSILIEKYKEKYAYDSLNDDKQKKQRIQQIEELILIREEILREAYVLLLRTSILENTPEHKRERAAKQLEYFYEFWREQYSYISNIRNGQNPILPLHSFQILVDRLLDCQQ